MKYSELAQELAERVNVKSKARSVKGRSATRDITIGEIQSVITKLFDIAGEQPKAFMGLLLAQLKRRWTGKR